MREVTVVGGGLAGLIAATECAEAGVPVRLLEARRRLGGRATTNPGEWHTNLGPHAFYAGGPMWDWLRARELHVPYRRPQLNGIRMRWQGEVRITPPTALLRAARALRHDAPVDVDLRSWLTDRVDAEAAAAVSGAAGVLTFDHDPGRLSAEFVWSRVRRILLKTPPVARYVVGGWGPVVDRLAAHARAVGVRVETNAKVDELPDGPVIVAVDPRAARRLLNDDALHASGPRTALLDIGLRARRGDPYLVIDLDEAAFVDRFTAVDKTLAPAGHSLVQAMIGLRPDESLDDGITRIETILDAGYRDWRDREVWRRRAVVSEATGALDLPGSTWRDRPAVQQREQLWLAGDWVAAPGHLSEVSCNSAVEAARAVQYASGIEVSTI
ncbi:MAG TPA: FAD-dependent oxidoreductase [Acidimicrobiia bacterium]|jgi:phytoene dehydrogenase-like protein|nr:FAD-dependent oxidoreductase [Acidimicrobiia bacterium]